MLNRPRYSASQLDESAYVPYTITSLSPPEVMQYSAPGILQVGGDGYVASCSVSIDGTFVETEFVSSSVLRATVPAGVTDNLGAHDIRVHGPLGRTSPTHWFVVLATPDLDSVTPSTIDAGIDAVGLTLAGDFFGTGSVAKIDGVDMPTGVVDRYTITASIPLALNLVIGTREITVENPGAGESAPVDITAEYPVPSITSFEPSFVPYGGGTATVVANGTGFFPGTTWTRNGSPLTVTYVSPTVVTFSQSDVLGTYAIAATNPTPGGGAGAPANIEVKYAVPTISSLDVQGDGNQAPYGGQSSILTVNGGVYGPGSVIRIDGVDVATTVVSGSQLTCTIPANVTAQPGAHSVTVFNPTPGGGTSAAATLNVVVTAYAVPGITLWIDPTRYIDTEYPSASYTLIASMSRPLSPYGTSPPTITISGTPSFTPLNLRLNITTGGARGTAVFRWSSDNGDTYTNGVLTAASVALTGTGLTINFPVATYNVGDSWESDTRVDNVTSRESASGVIDSTKTFNQTVASRRCALVRKHPSFGNRPALRVNGIAADTIILDNASTWSTPLPTPLTFFCVGFIPGRPAQASSFIMFCDTPSTAVIACGVTGSLAGSNPDKIVTAWGSPPVFGNNLPSADYFKGTPGIICIVADGTNATMYAGGLSFANTVAGVVWSQTLTKARIFNYAGGSVNTPWQSLAELLVFNRVLSTNELNTVGRSLASKFLLTWST